MNITKGQFHKRTLEDHLITAFQVVIVALIIFVGALFGVNAWMREDIARVAKLKQHFYEVSLSTSTDVTPPKPPAGVKPNYGESSAPKPTDLAKPKVTYFQDTSVKAKGGK